MTFPYRKILCPSDLDWSSTGALEEAAQLARHNDGTVFLLHVIAPVVAPVGMPRHVDVYKSEEDAVMARLREFAHSRARGIKYELLTRVGEPAGVILQAARTLPADVIVMATHGRRGMSRVFLGSVAERVVREAPCPVLTVRHRQPDKRLVARWMTTNPVTTTPKEKLAALQASMQQGGFRCAPVLDQGRLVGIVTDRDLRSHTGYLDHTEVAMAMSEELVTVTPTTPVGEAARLLLERKIGGLPVLDQDQLVGVITASDVLRAFVDSGGGGD